MSSTWQIDAIKRPIPRPKTMQVLCLGFSRTGTKSLFTALQILGYTPYHGNQLFAPQNVKQRHMKCWTEGLVGRREGTYTYGVAEFDKLLGHYDATTDGQSALFVDELINAYPEAKVILTTRDPDAWVRSMDTFYYGIISILRWGPLTYLDTLRWGPLKEIAETLVDELTGNDRYNRRALRQGFLKHNEKVRASVPTKNLLELQVKDDWGPLCNFLGKPKPDVPFPYVNEGNTATRSVLIGVIIDTVLRCVLPIGAVVAIWIAYKRY